MGILKQTKKPWQVKHKVTHRMVCATFLLWQLRRAIISGHLFSDFGSNRPEWQKEIKYISMITLWKLAAKKRNIKITKMKSILIYGHLLPFKYKSQNYVNKLPLIPSHSLSHAHLVFSLQKHKVQLRWHSSASTFQTDAYTMCRALPLSQLSATGAGSDAEGQQLFWIGTWADPTERWRAGSREQAPSQSSVHGLYGLTA